jgi:hypothetical protein
MSETHQGAPLSDENQVKIDAASIKQLRDFATLNLGIDIPPTANRARVLALMEQAAYTKDYILVDPTEEAVTAARALVASVSPAAARAKMPGSDEATKARDERMIEIIIPIQAEPGGKEPVRLGVNGRAMLVPRAKRVKIRYPYFEVLARAQKKVGDQDEKHQMTWSYVPQYPYQLIGGISEEEHAALCKPPAERGGSNIDEAEAA